MFALAMVLIGRSGNDTGEIPDDRYTPRLPTLERQAKISRATAYRQLAHLQQHDWFIRWDTDDRAKVAGRMLPGVDCDCGGPMKECQRDGCGKPVASRPNARFCSDACRARAYRQRRKKPSQKSVTPVSKSVTRHGFMRNGVTDFAVTPSLKIRDEPQVTGPETDVPDIESRTESRGKRAGLSARAENGSLEEPPGLSKPGVREQGQPTGPVGVEQDPESPEAELARAGDGADPGCDARGCTEPARRCGDGVYCQRHAVMLGATWPADTPLATEAGQPVGGPT
jgi:hypothetical protein